LCRIGETSADGDRLMLFNFLIPLKMKYYAMIVGALAFSSLRRERIWPAELLPRLQLLADGFASVLARQRADSAVRESDERRRQAEEEAAFRPDEEVLEERRKKAQPVMFLLVALAVVAVVWTVWRLFKA
jgi:hypothetical protein